ncbi:MAG TPA: response regulator transcription factor [Gammaproteobacteria bacterium]|nr:response regulator transcription factor [Gammaproteobacteria bacterium]
MKIRVLVADDHEIVRAGLTALLEGAPDIDVVGAARSGWEAVQKAEDLRPDVVLMDIAMPELNGIDAAALIRDRQIPVRVIVLSMLSSSEYVFRALEARVDGYLPKDSAAAELVAAIRVVNQGRRYLGEAVRHIVLDPTSRSQSSPLERLSARERRVLQLVAEGHTSAEIAQALQLSPKTVDSYRARIMTKLGVDNLSALVKFAVQHGVTPPT